MNFLKQQFKDDKLKIFIIAYFVIYFIISMFIVGDYGISSDEWIQRKHSLVNYKYVMETVFNREVPELQDIPELHEYGQLYGVALQLPMVFIEDIYNFSLSTHDIIYMRHMCTFIVVFLGYIFFYFALKNIFSNQRLIAIMGTMMISLYPRFFAYQFVDIKNLLFAGTCMISIYFMVKCVQEKKLIYEILFGISAALTTNVRIMGCVFLVIVLGYFLITDLMDVADKNRKTEINSSKIQIFRKYVSLLLAYIFAWILFTPMAWGNPIQIFKGTFSKFSNYSPWDGTMVFMGKFIKCAEVPWYYLFIWFGISIPIVYLLLFLYGHISCILEWVKDGCDWKDIFAKYKWFVCMVALFWGCVLSVIILHGRIYVGWHHLYFVFVFMCILACFGLENLLRKTRLRKLNISLFSVIMLFQVGWIIQNHPCEGAYFNSIGSLFADQFDREEWQTTSYEALQWILEHDEGEFSVLCPNSIDFLTDEEKTRVISEDVPEYIVSCYRNVIGNDLTYTGYEEVYTRKIGSYKVYSIFRRVE